MKKGVVLSLFLTVLIAGMDGITSTVKFTSSGADLSNTVVTTDGQGREVFTLADLTYKKNDSPAVSDLILSFNYEDYKLVKDDTDKYIIHSSTYDLIKGKGVLGEGGAGFLKENQKVEIETGRNLWLGNCGNLGSFSIEFRFYPVSLKDESVLFSRIGYFSGQKNGIDLVINQDRVSVRLYKLFKDARGRRFDIMLNRGRTLKEKNWYHFSLSFDSISGKLAKFLNGLEDEVVYVSETEEPFINVNIPSFTCVDLPLACIGKNFCGYIDEFRISYRSIEKMKSNTNVAFDGYKTLSVDKRDPENRGGTVTGPVSNFPSTGTSVTLFKWEEIIKKDTFVWMEFRISDALFTKDDTKLKWYRIVNNQRNIYLKEIEGGYLRGKYYQWRANLVPSPDGKFSPSIYNIELEYRLDPAPKPPLFFEAVKTGDRIIRLKWKKSVEHDIAGYKIYYGTEPGKYDGVIGYIGGNRITNELNKDRDFITVDITPEVVEENRGRAKNGILNYPLIKNNILYYFTISAYDSYKIDTEYNHESTQAKEISARPFAGSEIE